MNVEGNIISIPFHWSSSVLTITIVTLAILGGAIFYLSTLKWPLMMLWLKYLLITVLVATIVIGIIYMPIRLNIDNEKITVVRIFSSLEIPKQEIVEIKKIQRSEIDNSIRTFGSGGLFGYLGLFKNDKLGSYTMYATELNNLILIRTNNKKYIINCSNPEKPIENSDSDIQNTVL